MVLSDFIHRNKPNRINKAVVRSHGESCVDGCLVIIGMISTNYNTLRTRSERHFMEEGISAAMLQYARVRLGDYGTMQCLILCTIVASNNFLSY